MKLNWILARSVLIALVWLTIPTSAAERITERFYLSGHGKDDAVPWKFMCTTGALSGFWTNLPVPSNWELHGFGHLNYRKDSTNAWSERGLYEHEFVPPPKWRGQRVFLVFDGVMTDTKVVLNGESLGPSHQGSFYRFKYEVTKLIKLGAANKLEVDVAKHSANESVNKAERMGDYWIFGGIYRPVYLEAVPQEFIERVAIDARGDGAFTMDVFGEGVTSPEVVEAQIMTLKGKKLENSPWQRLDLSANDASAQRTGVRLVTRVDSPKTWTAETPNLYQVAVRLKRGKQVLHEFTQRFGFRTFEVRDGDGLYLNGKKVILKGVNRHSFLPDSGRCLSEAVHRLDINSIKEMNGNAVRMSHYPPDAEFLDLCDELGLYVLDELAGWHNHYDDHVGTRLVQSMVTRDVNHPSILFWDNGNEGGFNTNLDRLFGQYDPQSRRVLHPWAVFSGVNTAHYLMFTNAEVAARGEPMQYFAAVDRERVNTNIPNRLIYMPTEFMHGLYDGGAGAGLEDYWGMMMSHTNCAGGFIWAFLDESVKRPDTGVLDSAGNQAPDGIVGPYREREGSFYTIKDIWSPVRMTLLTNGMLHVENRFDFTNLKDLRFTFREEFRPLPFGTIEGALERKTVIGPNVDAGCAGTIVCPFPPLGAASERGLVVEVKDSAGRQVSALSSAEWSGIWAVSGSLNQATCEESDHALRLRYQDLEVAIDKSDGMIRGVKLAEQAISLTNGCRVFGGDSKLKEISHFKDGADYVVKCSYDGALKSVQWRLKGMSRWGRCLQCDYVFQANETKDAIGIFFDYPEQCVRRKRWLGDGPFRVWKNRMRGVSFGVWDNDYNDTITGYREWKYPEFKGCFSNVRWMQLDTTEGLITVVPKGIPFIQVLTPRQPPENLVGKTKVNLPECGLGFLHAIPPIGTKFKPAAAGGPQGLSNPGQGNYSGSVSFYFGKFP